jgi:hypothetical protein
MHAEQFGMIYKNSEVLKARWLQMVKQEKINPTPELTKEIDELEQLISLILTFEEVQAAMEKRTKEL